MASHAFGQVRTATLLQLQEDEETKDKKKKPKKGFLSCSTRKEQGSAVASWKVDPPGETSCGLDDGSAHRSKSVPSWGGELKQRGLPLIGSSHGTPGSEVKRSSFSVSNVPLPPK